MQKTSTRALLKNLHTKSCRLSLSGAFTPPDRIPCVRMYVSTQQMPLWFIPCGWTASNGFSNLSDGTANGLTTAMLPISAFAPPLGVPYVDAHLVRVGTMRWYVGPVAFAVVWRTLYKNVPSNSPSCQTGHVGLFFWLSQSVCPQKLIIQPISHVISTLYCGRCEK